MQLLPIIALCVLIGSAIKPAEASCSAGSCVLVWEDNFDGSAVDPLKWAFENGNGCQYGRTCAAGVTTSCSITAPKTPSSPTAN